MKKSLFTFAILTTIFLTTEPVAQKKPTPSATSKTTAAAKIEPVRTFSGVMKETRISIERSDWINEGNPLFEYRLAGARIVDGRIEFTGSLREAGKEKPEIVKATLISTNARSANPWPGANSPTARERRPASQTPQRERGEVSEQTQSLYSAAETGSGCEMIFLKMQPPNYQSTIQVGVVLAHRDNQLGNQINQAICRVVRVINAKENTDDALEKLNRSISRE